MSFFLSEAPAPRPSPTRRRPRGGVVVPGLDVAALKQKYGGDPGNKTQTTVGTFKRRLWDGNPTTLAAYTRWWEREKIAKLRFFHDFLERQGWVVDRIMLRDAGPAFDLLTGKQLPGVHEMHLVAVGGHPKAEPVRVEIDPAHLEPTVLNR